MNKNAIQFIESCLNMNIFYKILYHFLSFRGAALYHFGSAAASAADGGVDIPRGFAQVDMAAADDIKAYDYRTGYPPKLSFDSGT